MNWISDDDVELNEHLYLSFDMPIAGLHRAVVVGDLREIRRRIESGESVNQQEPNFNYTPLHIAVFYNNFELRDYLLSSKDVEIDPRCSKGKTPLHLAAERGRIESVKKLIQAGADVNITDNNNDTALHMSAKFPPVARLLIRHGARIRTDDSQKRTLHKAVRSGSLELVHMLLYYNVDADVPDEYGCTPFMLALIRGNEEAQDVLLEYVDDFNRSGSYYMSYSSTLGFALRSNSPFVRDVIQRGADVHYSDCQEDNAFAACVTGRPVDLSTFKMIWGSLRCNVFDYTIKLFSIYTHLRNLLRLLPVITESDNFELAVQLLSKLDNYLMIVCASAQNNFDLDQLTAFTCRLLEHGFRPSSYDVHAVFSHYGYCELFRILLYMDNDCSRGWKPCMALCRLMFDMDYDLESVADKVNDISKVAMLQLLEYSVWPRLLDCLAFVCSGDESMRAVLNNLPRVPSLVQLTRSAARKYIVQAFKVANSCQFYTTIDHLNIPAVYKDVLTFKRKIYTVK